MKDVNLLTSNGINVEKSLELFGTMEKYDMTVGVFLETIEGNVAKLKAHKEVGEMAQYARIAHSIKSEAQYFCFEDLAKLALKHELAGKANNILEVSEGFNEFVAEINRIVGVVSQYLGVETKSIINDAEVAESKDEAILVVDDSDTIIKYVQQIIDYKYEVLSACDGHEAITVIESDAKEKIIGMILDLNMPNVNGFEVLDYMNANNLFADIPICIITGTDDREVNWRAYQYPIVGILIKPFNERDLKEKIEQLIAYKNN